MTDPSDSMSETIQQVCAIPFRWQTEDCRFCLITSLKKKRWIFPKGIIDPGETPHESALKEAFEEAGLRGKIIGAPLGHFEDAKWDARLIVTVVVMEVTGVERTWPEAELRRRRWVSPEMATYMVSRPDLKQFIVQADQWLETNRQRLRSEGG